jgi:hypothetical protein
MPSLPEDNAKSSMIGFGALLAEAHVGMARRKGKRGYRPPLAGAKAQSRIGGIMR